MSVSEEILDMITEVIEERKHKGKINDRNI